MTEEVHCAGRSSKRSEKRQGGEGNMRAMEPMCPHSQQPEWDHPSSLRRGSSSQDASADGSGQRATVRSETSYAHFMQWQRRDNAASSLAEEEHEHPRDVGREGEEGWVKEGSCAVRTVHYNPSPSHAASAGRQQRTRRDISDAAILEILTESPFAGGCAQPSEGLPKARRSTILKEARKHSFNGSSLRPYLVFAVLAALCGVTGGWIALSPDGYTMKHNLIAQAGVTVEGDVRVNGVLISRPSRNLECTAERKGSVRWNDEFFETCDGEHDWQPAAFCSRTCDVNAQSVPCGLTVNNACGDACAQTGTGLNMRQCILRVASTPCSQEVADMCGNMCGIQGQFACSSSPAESGGLFLRALEGSASTAAFELQVGRPGAGAGDREALFLSYWDLPTSQEQELTVIRPLHENGVTGMEFAKPLGQDAATLRVSMQAELVGEHVQLGKSAHESHLFIDGVVDKECPLLFDGGGDDANFTRLCLETPTQQRALTFPDASGTVITSGNREDIAALRGLAGEDTLVFTGRFRDLGSVVPPRPPRLTCGAMACENRMTQGIAGSEGTGCLELDYAGREFDVFRLYYAFEDFGANALIRAPSAVLEQLVRANATGASRMELALLYLQLQEQVSGQRGVGAEAWAALRERGSFGAVTDLEECFVCCCGLLPNATQDGFCPPPRANPHFCVGGERDGHVCSEAAECPGGGACVDDASMSCFEHDHGFECFDLTQRPNMTTTLNFTASTAYRRLVMPDASGTIITTGNLQDVTSLGVLAAPLVGRATNSTTTTLRFERCWDAECGEQQVSSVLRNNTLLMPSSADGVLLTTGNLEDVTLDSGSVTGLRIASDLHVSGLLRFGDDALTSGIRLPPREASEHYTAAHGGQTPGNLKPGQLLFLVDESSLVLEFEPRRVEDAEQTAYLTVPAVDGTVVTSGNLEAVSRDAGALSSLSVGGSAYLEEGLTVGLDGGPRLNIQGERGGAIIFRDVANVTTGAEAVTTLRFQTQPQTQADILMPAASGTVITTGNLPDLSAFSGQQLNVSGAADLRGPVTLGSNGDTPVVLSGYLEGDIVYRSSPRYPGQQELPVTPPDTWDLRAQSSCANPVPGPSAEDPVATFPEWARYEVEAGFAERRVGSVSACQARAEQLQAGLVVRSKFVSALVQSTRSLQYLAALPLDTAAQLSEEDECFWPAENQTGLVNFTALPHLRTQWVRAAACQAARTLALSSAAAAQQWGGPEVVAGLLRVEILPVACGGSCAAAGACEVLSGRTCSVLIRSRVTLSYLSVASADKCTRGGQGEGGACVSWASMPSLWTMAARPPVTGFGDPQVTSNLFTLRRERVCVAVSEADEEEELACHGSSIASLQTVTWGQVQGVCGAYADASGAGLHCGNGTAQELREAVQAACVPGGCRVLVEGGRLELRGLWYGGAYGQNRTVHVGEQCAGEEGVRVVLQASCRAPAYLAMPAEEQERGGVVATTRASEATTVQVHTQASNKEELGRECWVVRTAGPNCELRRDEEHDVHWRMKEEATRLSFAVPTAARRQWFPDASGTIIASGNLEDISELRGLKGPDTFVYQHAADPGSPTTILDFAAIGTAPADRVDGPLPDYSLPDGTPAHPSPIGPHRRITFPDATGTVITTGNTDDLVFKSIQLQGLEMQVEANFGDSGAAPTYVNLGQSSRISGCFNFVHEEEDAEYTQLCAVPATHNNYILLPDESGTVLTTGNLLNLPSIRIPDAHFFVGGDATFEGKMQFGMPSEVTTLQMYTWVDGDVGMTFSGAGALKANRLQLNVPYMGGVDRAIRAYLSGPAADLAVNVQGGAAFRSPVANSSRINESVCLELLAEERVMEFHDLGHFLLANALVRKTLLEGTPYAGLLLPGSPDSALCRHHLTNTSLCTPDGPCQCPAGTALPGIPLLLPPLPLPCNGSGWDCGGTLGLGCSGAQEAACAFDDNASTTLSYERPARLGLIEAVADEIELRTECEWVLVQDPNAPVMVPAYNCSVRPPWANASVNGSAWSEWVAECNSSVSVTLEQNATVAGHVLNGSCATVNGSLVNCTVADQPLTCEVVRTQCVPAGSNCSMVNGSLSNCSLLPNCSTIIERVAAPVATILQCAAPRCFWRSDGAEANCSEVDCVALSASNSSSSNSSSSSSANASASALLTCAAPVCVEERVLGACSAGGAPVECTLGPSGTLLCTNASAPSVTNSSEPGWPRWQQVCSTYREELSQTVAVACVLGKRFSSAREVSLARVLPLPGRGAAVLGARLEGATDANGTEWVGLFQFELSLSEAGWNTVRLQGPPGALYYHVRYVGRACVEGEGCEECGGLEMEWHEGRISAVLAPIEGGQSSAFVDERALQRTAVGASVLKCASEGWFPNYLRLRSQELMLPETSGVLLTTGNLRDITKEAGALSSLGVNGEVLVAGSTQIGEPGGDAQLQVNSQLEGRFPLAFSESGGSSSVLTLHVPDPTFDNLLHFPDASGTIVTSGSLPTVMEQLVVTGAAQIRGPVVMDGDVTIGDALSPSSLSLNSAIASAFPLSFSGSSPANPTLSLGIEDPTADRLLVLPDVSGTVLTTGNLPEVLHSASFAGEALFRGGAALLGAKVVLGQGEGEGGGKRSSLEVHAVMGGGRPLQLEGAAQDRRTLSLAIEEPSGHNVITLPDVTGTVITTGNFPDIVEQLHVLGSAQLEGKVSLVGPTVMLGTAERPGRVEINAVITGRFPLVFSDAEEGEEWAGSTTLEITPPTSSNIISFPDVSGTVITTSNMPTTVMLPDEDYTIQARSLVVRAGSVALGAAATPPEHAGSFVFTDSAENLQSGAPFGSKRANSFNVRATGGVKLVTGHTASGRELGVVLEPGASAWSVLSDRASKHHVEPVDQVAVLRKLVAGVPVSRWQYEGDGTVHMGPMAQDWRAAFEVGDESGESISTVDADGVALAALQGLHRLHQELEREVEEVRARARRAREEVERNRARLRAQEEAMSAQAHSLQQLLRLLRSPDHVL